MNLKFTPKQARQHTGLTQKEMANILGITPQTLLKYEKNPDTMTIGILKKLSEVMARFIGIDRSTIHKKLKGSNLTPIIGKRYYSADLLKLMMSD